MTNQEKAESCGEYVRDSLDCLRLEEEFTQAGLNHFRMSNTGMIKQDWSTERDRVVEGARQAAHWGRLALAERSA